MLRLGCCGGRAKAATNTQRCRPAPKPEATPWPACLHEFQLLGRECVQPGRDGGGVVVQGQLLQQAVEQVVPVCGMEEQGMCVMGSLYETALRAASCPPAAGSQTGRACLGG